MTLHVTLNQFSETAKRVLGTNDAYLKSTPRGTYVTAAHPNQERMVAAWHPGPASEARATLQKKGMTVHEGAWALDGETPGEPSEREEIHIAAVSYISEDAQPGVWIDAYQTLPTQVQVLKALYEEFRETGEMPDVSFEEFVRLAKPNVVVASPPEIAGYLEAKYTEC